MSFLRLLVLLAFAVAPATQPDDPRLGQLIGAWRVESGNLVITERWEADPEGLVRGFGETRRGGKLLQTEKLWIRRDAQGRLEYVAQPSSAQAATAFTLQDASLDPAQPLVFANDAHDFPRVISYRFVGADRIDIRLTGVGRAGQAIEQVWTYVRER